MASGGARPKEVPLSRPQVVYTKPVELWCRTSALLLQEGTRSVRKIFDDQIKHNGGDLKTVLNNHKAFIELNSQKTQSEADSNKKLTCENYQTLSKVTVSSEDFDLTLLKFLFQNVITINSNSQTKKIFKFIRDIVKIRNKLFHCGQLLENFKDIDKLNNLWTELVQTLQHGWLIKYGAYVDNVLLHKYAIDKIEHDSKYLVDWLKKQYDNDIEEKRNILSRVTELLENFHSKNEELNKNYYDQMSLLSKSHFKLSVENIHSLLGGLPERIREMILDKAAVKDIREQLEKHCQQNDNIIALIQGLGTALQEIKKNDSHLLQGQDKILDEVNKKAEEIKDMIHDLKIKAVSRNCVQYEILNISSLRVFWDRVPGVDKYQVTVLCVQTGNNTVKTELRESCVLDDLTQGDYLVKVAAVQNIAGASPNDESCYDVLNIMETEVLKKELLNSTKTSWSTEPDPSDWIDLDRENNGQRNTNSTGFMADLQGYIPVRLIPLLGIYLKTDDTLDKTNVDRWLQSGMRFFYITFDIAINTKLLSILSDFVKEMSTEGIIVMYNRKFRSDNNIPGLVPMPDNAMWKFDYTKLKLHDIRGKVVMLDSKKHKLFDNRIIYDPCSHSETETSENRCLELDYQLKSNKVFTKLSETLNIDNVSLANTDIKHFLQEYCETLDSCHTQEAPLMISCIGLDTDTKILTETIESNTSIMNCGAVAFQVSCESPVSKLIPCTHRWQNMVKFLLDSIETQFKFSVLDDFVPALIRENLKQGLLPQLIAINRASLYFSKIIKDEIGSNKMRYHDLLDRLVHQSVIYGKHRKILNSALTDNIKYEDELMDIIQRRMTEMETDSVDDYLDRFLNVLMMNHKTRPIAYLIKELVEKAVACSYYDEDTDSSRFLLTVGITLKSVNETRDSLTQQDTRAEVMGNVSGFSDEVLGVGCENLNLLKKCIHISFDVAFNWDLQVVKTSVEHGIFLRRYCRWVTEKGFVYVGDEPVYITFSVDGEVVFVHQQNTLPRKSDYTAMVVDIPTGGPVSSSEYQEKKKEGHLKRLQMPVITTCELQDEDTISHGVNNKSWSRSRPIQELQNTSEVVPRYAKIHGVIAGENVTAECLSGRLSSASVTAATSKNTTFDLFENIHTIAENSGINIKGIVTHKSEPTITSLTNKPFFQVTLQDIGNHTIEMLIEDDHDRVSEVENGKAYIFRNVIWKKDHLLFSTESEVGSELTMTEVVHVESSEYASNYNF